MAARIGGLDGAPQELEDRPYLAIHFLVGATIADTQQPAAMSVAIAATPSSVWQDLWQVGSRILGLSRQHA